MPPFKKKKKEKKRKEKDIILMRSQGVLYVDQRGCVK